MSKNEKSSQSNASVHPVVIQVQPGSPMEIMMKLNDAIEAKQNSVTVSHYWYWCEKIEKLKLDLKNKT